MYYNSIPGRNHLGDLNDDGRIIPKCILKKVCDGADGIDLAQDEGCELL
jgi:hypothetical protein